MFRVDVTDPKGLRALSKDCKRAGAGLVRDLNSELRKPAKSVGTFIRHSITRANVDAEPVPGAKRRFQRGVGNRLPMKKPTADAVKWTVRVTGGNPRIELTFSMFRMPVRIRQLFPYWTGARIRLRHPIMGKNPDGSWRGGVNQKLPNVWRHAKKLAPMAQATTGKVLDKTADVIAGRRR